MIIFRFLKKLIYFILIILFAVNLYVIIKGDWYFYSVLKHTVFRGRLGPVINEFRKDNMAPIANGNFVEHPFSIDYNKKNLSPEFLNYVNEYGTVSYLVLHNDSIVHEEYWDGWSKDSLSNSYSMAKSVVGLLVGCAIQDGAIKSVDESICKYLTDFNCEVNQKVTIKNLLTMSSGIDFDESYISPFAFSAEALYTSNLHDAVYEHSLISEPGKVFDYQSGNTELLCLILEKATGKKLADYASEKIWRKIGAEQNAFWSADEQKLARAFCCLISNARDFSRLGLLINHQGNLYNNQIIDSTYLMQATTAYTEMLDDGIPCQKYGYQFWMMKYKGLDIKYYRGILGQYIICIPSKNIVAVRLGKRRSKEKVDGHPTDVYKIINESLDLSGINLK